MGLYSDSLLAMQDEDLMVAIEGAASIVPPTNVEVTATIGPVSDALLEAAGAAYAGRCSRRLDPSGRKEMWIRMKDRTPVFLHGRTPEVRRTW